MAAVVVTNMSANQRQRLRDTASSMTSKVKSSETVEKLADVVSLADEAAADTIADTVDSTTG